MRDGGWARDYARELAGRGR